MRITNLLGASLLMVSPFILAETESEAAFDSYEVALKDVRGFETTGGAIKYATYAASSAQSIYSDRTYSYAGGGCLSNTSATSTIFLDESLNINIPIGSIIVSAGYFYTNSADGSSDLTIFTASDEGVFDVEATVNSAVGSSSAGKFMWLTTTSKKSLTARFTMAKNPSANACMARIGYIPYDIADDVIYANKFEY